MRQSILATGCLLLTLATAALAQPVCDASQFNGRAGVHVTSAQCQHIRGTLRPGNGSTFEGMQLDRVELDSSVGVTLRGNTIRATGQGYTLRITGTQQRLRIEGNVLESQVTGTWHTVLITHASANEVVFRGNTFRNHGPGGEDLLQMYNWSGTWHLEGNTFGANPAEDHIDIKYSTLGRAAHLSLTGNTFHGAVVQGACVLLHNASDRGIGGGYRYTVDIKENRFHACEAAVYHRISTRQGESDPGNRYLTMQGNVIAGGKVVIESDNATVRGNIFARATLKIGANGNHPSNVQAQDNQFTDSGEVPSLPPAAAAPGPAPRNLRILQ